MVDLPKQEVYVSTVRFWCVLLDLAGVVQYVLDQYTNVSPKLDQYTMCAEPIYSCIDSVQACTDSVQMCIESIQVCTPHFGAVQIKIP